MTILQSKKKKISDDYDNNIRLKGEIPTWQEKGPHDFYLELFEMGTMLVIWPVFTQTELRNIRAGTEWVSVSVRIRVA